MTDNIHQLTSEEAIAFGESRAWEGWTDIEIVTFQFHQRMLCIPFAVYHAAMERVLERPVFTHEFGSAGREQLRAEIEGRVDEKRGRHA